MSRLTKAMIEEIVKNAKKKAGIDDRRAAYNADRAKLFEACRIENCGGAEAEAKLREKEQAFQELRSQLTQYQREPGVSRLVNQEFRVIVSFGGCTDRQDFEDMRIVPANRLLLAADHPLTVEWERLCSVEHEIDELAETVATNVRGMLSQLTTIKKLIEVWPEARELLPPEKGAAPSINLPAVQVASLNAMIGLPSEQQAE